MSEISIIAEQIARLKEGEITVLKRLLEVIRTDIETANSLADIAVGWSKYAIKTQKNPYLADVIDPYTGEPIEEPDIQVIDDYPIVFGNAENESIGNRTVTFAFGAKAFLCYENNATGIAYSDERIGNSFSDLGEIEVVNYRTLKATLNSFSSATILAQTYINKATDATAHGSTHEFGTVFLRGGDEKSYYGVTSANPTYEIAVKGDLASYEEALATLSIDARAYTDAEILALSTEVEGYTDAEITALSEYVRGDLEAYVADALVTVNAFMEQTAIDFTTLSEYAEDYTDAQITAQSISWNDTRILGEAEDYTDAAIAALSLSEAFSAISISLNCIFARLNAHGI